MTNTAEKELVNFMHDLVDEEASDQTGPPYTLYHYTDIGGVEGIIEHHKFWATDYRFLNDMTDCIYGRDLAEGYLKEIRRNLRIDKKKEYLDKTLELLNKYKTDWADKVPPIFLVSLSEKGDLLSQWRGYADDTKGYSVGLRRRDLKRERRPSPYSRIRLRKVEYSAEEQKKRIKDIQEKIYNKADSLNILSKAPLSLYVALVIQSTSFKDPAYKEEKEWRAVLLRTQKYQSDMPIKYRTRGGVLVPYLEFSMSMENEIVQPISNIICGPNSDITTREISLPAYCVKHGYEELEIKESAIPHRN